MPPPRKSSRPKRISKSTFDDSFEYDIPGQKRPNKAAKPSAKRVKQTVKTISSKSRKQNAVGKPFPIKVKMFDHKKVKPSGDQVGKVKRGGSTKTNTAGKLDLSKEEKDLNKEEKVDLNKELRVDLEKEENIDMDKEENVELDKEENIDLDKEKKVDLNKEETVDLPRPVSDSGYWQPVVVLEKSNAKNEKSSRKAQVSKSSQDKSTEDAAYVPSKKVRSRTSLVGEVLRKQTLLRNWVDSIPTNVEVDSGIDLSEQIHCKEACEIEQDSTDYPALNLTSMSSLAPNSPLFGSKNIRGKAKNYTKPPLHPIASCSSITGSEDTQDEISDTTGLVGNEDSFYIHLRKSVRRPRRVGADNCDNASLSSVLYNAVTSQIKKFQEANALVYYRLAKVKHLMNAKDAEIALLKRKLEKYEPPR